MTSTAVSSRRARQSGVTLLELLVAVSLVALLSVAMAIALRISLDGTSKAQNYISANRRVLGVERILREQVSNMMPASTSCRSDPESGGLSLPLFEGLPGAMRLVSTYSLAEAGRGVPRLLEYSVIPGENGQGVRLVVNELPWTGPAPAFSICNGVGANPENGNPFGRFVPIQISGASFVLADKLAFCRIAYQELRPPPVIARWTDHWTGADLWPTAVRIEMAPLAGDMSHLQLSSITIPIQMNRDITREYID